MQHYQTVNRICGWSCFVISAIVYVLTVEPSASFWDCPEFILSAARLEVGHPPGAPFFMLAGNLFSHFAPNATYIAYCINIMNALLSAGCILFLFWSITHLTDRLLPEQNPKADKWRMAAVMGSGFTGALAYAFSDTFWYSAVEGEVYAFSSFLTALSFWIILKWEDEADSVRSDRWIILLAYIIGLSIGVHLLNLLCIPAIGLVVYYRKTQKPDKKGTAITLCLSFLIMATVLYGIMPGVMKAAGLSELLAVNVLHLPYNLGMLIYVAILAGCLVWSCTESRKGSSPLRMCIALLAGICLSGITLQGSTAIIISVTLLTAGLVFGLLYPRLKKAAAPGIWRILHIFSFSLLMIMTGYASYALIIIRATANPPMNQQSPDNPFALKGYLAREQYGDIPLLYGPTFVSPHAWEEKDGYLTTRYKEGETEYRRINQLCDTDEERYVATGHKMTPVYQPETCVWFPRMYKEESADGYRSWLGELQGKTVTYHDKISGEDTRIVIPSLWDNVRYLISYQINFMYWRYFLWNFVGRQNDIQGVGETENGNWITGFGFIDKWLTGNVKDLPDSMRNNKGRNVYFGIPLLLGLAGVFWQIRQGRNGQRQCSVIFMLFVMTGLAIILYLNQTPAQVRERDYAYAGSFYAFAIWIGMGAAALYTFLKKKWNTRKACLGVLAVAILVPIQIISQTWDDHDRSGRYLCRDTGYNYLNTLPEKGNPILFVNGDNDTFPLWYSTEVEGVRRDARVCNLMYLTGGWYVEQMRQPAYSAPGLPVSIPKAFCRDGVNDYARINPVIGTKEDGTPVRMKDEIEKIYREHPESKPFGEDPWEWNNIVKYWLTSDDESMRCIPTDEIHIPVDKKAVRRSGMTIPPGTEIPDTMVIRLGSRNYLTRSGIILLDLIRQCNWERPLYVAISVNVNEYLDLSDHLLQEGMASRIVPFNTGDRKLDTEKMYQNITRKFKFGGLENPDLYLDDSNLSMALSLQRCITETAEELHRQGKDAEARNILTIGEQHIRHPQILSDPDSYSYRAGVLTTLLGDKEKGRKLWQYTYDNLSQTVNWYNSLPDRKLWLSEKGMVRTLYQWDTVIRVGISGDILTHDQDLYDYIHQLQLAEKRLTQCGSPYASFVKDMLQSYLQSNTGKEKK